MTDAPVPAALADLVRRRLGLSSREPVDVREVTQHANLNYVFRVVLAARSLYVKVALPKSKKLGLPMPATRVLYEAEALRTLAPLAGPTLVTPEVVFVDEERFVLAMGDVGIGRRVLLDVIDDEYATHTAAALPLGRALGRLHGRTRGRPSFRPPASEAALRAVVFDGLLAPGAAALFPESWEGVRREMTAHSECAVHMDLWAKNLLVKAGAVPAVVDFEAVSIGDPALDLGTVLAVFLIPVLRDPSHTGYPDLVRALLAGHAAGSGDPAWSAAAASRAFRYVGTFLAARGFGPFQYPMSEAVRERLGRIARRLTREAPADVAGYLAGVTATGGADDASPSALVPDQ
jgi:tRNA A-37 threonylcarbamoyl transferase component Bud32